MDSLRRAVHQYAGKEHVFQHDMTEEHIRLVSNQKELDSSSLFPSKGKDTSGKVKGGFVGMSLRDTIYLLLTMGDPGMGPADRLKKDFKMPDRIFW